MKLVCFSMILLLVAVVQGWKDCTKNKQCAKGECCQRLNNNPIVSRRDLEDSRPLTGTCQPYKPEGNACSPFDKVNGYCSCEPGTECKSAKDPVTPQYRSERSILVKPGYSLKCVKK